MERKRKSGKGRKSGRLEITMYKLLVIFVISIFVALGFGVSLGQTLGEAQTLNALEVPSYCSVDSNSERNAITCLEIGTNMSASDVCTLLSTPVKEKLRVVIIP